MTTQERCVYNIRIIPVCTGMYYVTQDVTSSLGLCYAHTPFQGMGGPYRNNKTITIGSNHTVIIVVK